MSSKIGGGSSMEVTSCWWEKAEPTDKKCFVCSKREEVRTDAIDCGGNADWALTPIPWELCLECKKEGWIPINAGMVLAYINKILRKVKSNEDGFEDERYLGLFGL